MDNQYTIRQLSQLSGLSAHTLRYYEKAGLMQAIARTGNGYRVYEERDLAWVQLLHQLRTTGMPIRQLKQLADWRSQGSGTLADRRVMLEKHREEVRRHMEELQASLVQIDRKVELYRALEKQPSLRQFDEDNTMKAYYAQRAEHYERIYYRDDPVRQAELRAMEQVLTRELAEKRVLEVACGTGYWTATAAGTAAHITATDATPETLDIARNKTLPAHKVDFVQGDAYELQAVPRTFNAALAMFWFSHVPRSRISGFLDQLHRRIGSGAVVVMADNTLVPGIGGKLVVKPGEADTYKLRELQDGTKHEVLKNYFTEQQLRDLFEPLSTELSIEMGECFWWLSYKVR